MQLNYKKTFLLGFGFFAINVAWALYNSYVPIFLGEFIASNAIIGFIMTLDNYAGLFLQPIFGTLSDRTRTRFGRRMPYLLVGMPLAALFVSLVPHYWSLASLIVIIVSLNLVMASFRSPTVALMPDITHESLRSKANGIINLMSGMGAIIAFLVGSRLYLKNSGYPFYMASILMIISILILYFTIKEKRDSLNYDEAPAPRTKADTNKESAGIFSRQNRSILLLLAAIFFWFTSFNAVETFFTRYGKNFLGVNEAIASSKLTFYSLAMVAFAIPAGIIATRIGKKKTIFIGLVLIILLFGGLFYSTDINTIGYLFIIAGISATLIHINSYPLVVSMTTSSNIGRFTGYYYLASSLANIVSPPLAGGLMDIFGYGILFKYAVVGFILALVCLLMVKTPSEKPLVTEL